MNYTREQFYKSKEWTSFRLMIIEQHTDADGHVYIGSSANDVICTAIISGFRVYDGFAFEEATAEEIVAILGGENE